MAVTVYRSTQLRQELDHRRAFLHVTRDKAACPVVTALSLLMTCVAQMAHVFCGILDIRFMHNALVIPSV